MKQDAYDVIVVGVGVMGAAACRELARRGLRVLGLEQFHFGHDFGSSHGRTRVIRHAYFEDPLYVPMVRESWTAWKQLESRCGESLLVETGCVNIGPADHEAIRGVRRSVETHGLPAEVLAAAEIERRWPAFQCHPGDIGVFEDHAGFLRPEACSRALAGEARAVGASLIERCAVPSWDADERGVRIRTDGGEFHASHLVLTAGAWLPTLTADLKVSLAVERQVQCWFAPREPNLFAVGRMPVFIHFTGGSSYYGIPSSGPEGVKIARHHGGRITTAASVDRSILETDEGDVRGYIRRHLPQADGPLLEGRVCLYTNTPDSHFILDRHPMYRRVVIAGGFSGHGFKFAPVIGRMLADLVCDPACRGPEVFSLARFAS